MARTDYCLGPHAPMDDYERHMKYGPPREYWNDFVFEANVNHQSDAIFLAGLPDIPESRPHPRVSEEQGTSCRAEIPTRSTLN